MLARRLATFRREDTGGHAVRPSAAGSGRHRSMELASRLATALDAEVVTTPHGSIVRVEIRARALPLDREALARLPGQPPADVPLVCLDTETTGLATAAGTVAFLVGLGWWEGIRFRQVQLLLPDQPDEPALLDLLASMIPSSSWLVTYNGRGFDWPLLVARFRMARRDAPPHAGHLDLLATVRRLFRHRMADARLRTAEEALLGVARVDDVEGWEIPGRYLSFLRGGDPQPLVPVVQHNDRDVRSLACLLAHLADELGSHNRRRLAPDGDLLGLARTFQREGRLDEALQCLDMAVQRPPRPAATLPAAATSGPRGTLSSPRAIASRPVGAIASRPAIGPRPTVVPSAWLVDRTDDIRVAIAQLSQARLARLTRDQLARERARLLRRLGRRDEARLAWHALAGSSGPLAAVAYMELAKILEHIERDFPAALDAVTAADRLVARSASVDAPLPGLHADLRRRRARLVRRAAADAGRAPAALQTPARGPHAVAQAPPNG